MTRPLGPYPPSLLREEPQRDRRRILHSAGRDDHTPRWAGKIGYTALREACEFFEVVLPVVIRRGNGIQRLGSRQFRDDEHRVSVSTYSTTERANRTILHELCHAAQGERLGEGEFDRLYQEAGTYGTTGYATNPFEVEARAASEFSGDFRIAV